MRIEKFGRVLPFSCEQIFDLAADFERYPDFLPWWISASIKKREANIWYAEQVLGRGPVRVQFASKALLHRPERIDITSSDRLFRQYNLSLVVAPGPSAGCSLSIAAELELRSRFLQQILCRVLPASIEGIIAAFEARAHKVYDHHDR